MSTRKPVYTSVSDRFNKLIAVCNDGTAWTRPLNDDSAEWEQIPPIPQPKPNLVHPWIITINGEQFALDEKTKLISYETICIMADKNPLRDPIVTLHFENCGELVMVNDSNLKPGQSIRLERGMVFTVANS